MNTNNIEKLKVAVNQFYLGKYLDQPTLDDKIYDELVAEYELENGKNSTKNLIEFPEGLVREVSIPEAALGKDKIDGDFAPYINNYLRNLERTSGRKLDHYLNYKYDGCGIKAFYKNGRLYRIQTTPDEAYGIIRTKAFYDLFPKTLNDKSIMTIRGEVLVDASVYGELARNQANGYANSQYKDEEVRNECFIRAYKIQFWNADYTGVDETYDYNRQTKALEDLPRIRMVRTRPVLVNGKIETMTMQDDIVFCAAEKLTSCPEETINQEVQVAMETPVKFQVDGVVCYNEVDCHAFKFYYTDFKDVEVKEISWEYNWNNGSYIPKIYYDTITLNGKSNNCCSANGVNNLCDNHMGRGAIVRIVMAGLTIPQAVKVLKPSDDFMFPKCDCGEQLSRDDQYGSVLKCHNLECSKRISAIYDQLMNWGYRQEYDGVKTYRWRIPIEEFAKENPHWFAAWLGIDRFNPTKRYNNLISTDELNSKLFELCHSGNATYKEIQNLIESNYYMSWLMTSLAQLNYMTLYEAVQKYMNNPEYDTRTSIE